MNKIENAINNILITMRNHLDTQTLEILSVTLSKNLVDIDKEDNLPATIDNTNEYIIDLFKTTKAPRLSQKTVDFYLNTITRLIDSTNKKLTEITLLYIIDTSIMEIGMRQHRQHKLLYWTLYNCAVHQNSYFSCKRNNTYYIRISIN